MLTYSFEDRGGESLYGHLYRCIRRDIESGAIQPDAKLPSKRALAKHLGVSLITVEGAYTQLVAEGYVRSVPRTGYFANRLEHPVYADVPYRSGMACSAADGLDGGAASAGKDARELRSSAAARAEATPACEGCAHSDAPAPSVAADLFPSAAWARTVRDVLSHEPKHKLVAESPSMGLPRLREALAAHVRAFRGLDADPRQILVGSGAQTLYGLIVQLVGREGHFAVEDPGYPRLTSIYRAHGVRLSHVPLDSAGINISALSASGANVVHLMPSHQYPTGRVTPASRRYELLGWAAEAAGRCIVEDDYDCEFRLSGRPIPAMKSIDTMDCVIYTNTFSRSLGPAFRVGYAVLPVHFAEKFERELGFYSSTVSTMEQLALARFIENGDFERHINRMRTRLRALRACLVEALDKNGIAGFVDMEGADAGLHFLLHVRTRALEEDVARAVRAEGMGIVPLSAFRLGGGAPMQCVEVDDGGIPRRSFVVSYGGLDEAAIARAVRALAQVAAD